MRIARCSLLILLSGCIYAKNQIPHAVFEGGIHFKSEDIQRGSLKAKRGIEPHMMLLVKNEKRGFYVETKAFLPTQCKNLFGDRWMLGAGYLQKLTDFFTWDLGAQYNFLYRIPKDQLGHWRELYTGIKTDLLLAPSFYIYHDFERRQWCWEIKFNYDFDLEVFGWKHWTLETICTYGYLKYKKPFGGVRSNVWERKDHYWYTELSLFLTYHFNDYCCAKIGPQFSYNRDGTNPYSSANEATHHSHLCSLNAGLSYYF
ncbi:MAG: hypothetical protein LBJ78_03215 [Puniceicoccales bacterium]|jgi:hypothetical protein|nr:hypothetical protein [Puniceicoccales bacterium]